MRYESLTVVYIRRNALPKSNEFHGDWVNTVNWNPDDPHGGPGTGGSCIRPPFVGLAHEIGHAISRVSGYAHGRVRQSDPQWKNKEESYACSLENAVRLGTPDLEQRKRY
jgi:hypothetical protein